MHDEQINFCQETKKKFPHFFKNKRVLDVGSLNVNGTNERYFDNCEYIGIDVAPGPNVDVVTLGHLYDPDELFDTIISSECFEHDMYYEKTFQNIIKILKPGGLFLFTCAAPGRDEHGTARTRPEDSPLTSTVLSQFPYFEKWSNYYRNISKKDLNKALDLKKIFSKYYVDEHHEILIDPVRQINDLYFWGIKKHKK